MNKGAIYEEMAQIFSVFTSSMTRYLVIGTWILNSFGTSGDNDENVLVKICNAPVKLFCPLPTLRGSPKVRGKMCDKKGRGTGKKSD